MSSKAGRQTMVVVDDILASLMGEAPTPNSNANQNPSTEPTGAISNYQQLPSNAFQDENSTSTNDLPPNCPAPMAGESYHNSSWFFKQCSRGDAESMLRGKATGAFLVRPSSQAGCLSLSHVNDDGSVGHGIIHRWEPSSGREGWSIESEAKTHATLSALLLSLPLAYGLVTSGNKNQSNTPVQRTSFPCPVCGKLYPMAEDIEIHVAKRHSSLPPPESTPDNTTAAQAPRMSALQSVPQPIANDARSMNTYPQPKFLDDEEDTSNDPYPAKATPPRAQPVASRPSPTSAAPLSPTLSRPTPATPPSRPTPTSAAPLSPLPSRAHPAQKPPSRAHPRATPPTRSPASPSLPQRRSLPQPSSGPKKGSFHGKSRALPSPGLNSSGERPKSPVVNGGDYVPPPSRRQGSGKRIMGPPQHLSSPSNNNAAPPRPVDRPEPTVKPSESDTPDQYQALPSQPKSVTPVGLPASPSSRPPFQPVGSTSPVVRRGNDTPSTRDNPPLPVSASPTIDLSTLKRSPPRAASPLSSSLTLPKTVLDEQLGAKSGYGTMTFAASATSPRESRRDAFSGAIILTINIPHIETTSKIKFELNFTIDAAVAHIMDVLLKKGLLYGQDMSQKYCLWTMRARTKPGSPDKRVTRTLSLMPDDAQLGEYNLEMGEVVYLKPVFTPTDTATQRDRLQKLDSQQKNTSSVPNTPIIAPAETAKAALPAPIGEGSIQHAAQQGDLARVREYIAKGAAFVDNQDIHGNTALMWSAARGHVEVLSALIDGGAQLDLQSKNGLTALAYASRKGKTNVVQRLLAAQANANLRNNDGQSPLSFAAKNGHLEIIRSLIKAGADVTQRDNPALLAASKKGHIDVVRELLKAGADKNVANISGQRAVDLARTPEIKQLLNEWGPDVVSTVPIEVPLNNNSTQVSFEISNFPPNSKLLIEDQEFTLNRNENGATVTVQFTAPESTFACFKNLELKSSDGARCVIHSALKYGRARAPVAASMRIKAFDLDKSAKSPPLSRRALASSSTMPISRTPPGPPPGLPPTMPSTRTTRSARTPAPVSRHEPPPALSAPPPLQPPPLSPRRPSQQDDAPSFEATSNAALPPPVVPPEPADDIVQPPPAPTSAPVERPAPVPRRGAAPPPRPGGPPPAARVSSMRLSPRGAAGRTSTPPPRSMPKPPSSSSTPAATDPCSQIQQSLQYTAPLTASSPLVHWFINVLRELSPVEFKGFCRMTTGDKETVPQNLTLAKASSSSVTFDNNTLQLPECESQSALASKLKEAILMALMG